MMPVLLMATCRVGISAPSLSSMACFNLPYRLTKISVIGQTNFLTVLPVLHRIFLLGLAVPISLNPCPPNKGHFVHPRPVLKLGIGKAPMARYYGVWESICDENNNCSKDWVKCYLLTDD